MLDFEWNKFKIGIKRDPFMNKTNCRLGEEW